MTLAAGLQWSSLGSLFNHCYYKTTRKDLITIQVVHGVTIAWMVCLFMCLLTGDLTFLTMQAPQNVRTKFRKGAVNLLISH